MARARFHKTLFIPPVEGQYKVWKTELAPIAGKVDEIFQLGNLIGCTELAKDSANRGPNLAVLKFITLWRSTYSNWTQIVGPNEIMALNFPDEWTNNESNRLLRRRWLSEDQSRGFQVAGVSKGRLVTHGGLTHGLWSEIGKPTTAREAADVLNERFIGSLYQGPCWVKGNTPNSGADPIFSNPIRELYPSWILSNEKMPFDQMHSSGGLNTVEGREALASGFSLLDHFENVRYTAFGSECDLVSGGTFISISPELPTDKIVTRYPDPWRVYVEKTPVVDLRDEMFTDDS